jgi:acetyltransferase-like isoleucine patch superfamily enzyme
MNSFFSLVTNKKYWAAHSILIKFILKLYGVQVGKGFYIEGTPKVKIHGKGENIRIGDHVSVLGSIDLRNRENGKIFIDDHVSIDNDVRLVSAREGTIHIGEHSAIGPHTIINGGGNVVIGKKALFAKNISINANDHNHARGACIRDQGFTHADVIIEDDVWLGANVCVNKGVLIRQGSIVGANAVVTKDTEAYSINAGVPARKIGERI